MGQQGLKGIFQDFTSHSWFNPPPHPSFHNLYYILLLNFIYYRVLQLSYLAGILESDTPYIKVCCFPFMFKEYFYINGQIQVQP